MPSAATCTRQVYMPPGARSAGELEGKLLTSSMTRHIDDVSTFELWERVMRVVDLLDVRLRLKRSAFLCNWR